MALNTAGDLIAFALRAASVNGVGQSPIAEDLNDGMVILSSMIAQWQRKRWLVYADAETAKVSTGAATYTVGLGGDFAIPRPDRLEAAFVRLLGTAGNALDRDLAIIESREDWSGIGLKGMSTFPVAVFYESAWPLGILHPWPIPPASQYEIHIVTKAALPVYATLTTPLNLPPEYIEALIWSLEVRLAQQYGLEPKPSAVQSMRAALNTLRQANTQVSGLDMPGGLGGRRGSSVAAGSSPSFQSGQW
jgi:hypothetical protein